MNEYINKSLAENFESQKLRHDLLSDIRYPNNINFAIRDPTNVGGHLELSYVKHIYDNQERNPYLQNMNPIIRMPYCKPYYSDTEPNSFWFSIRISL
jgi:hypothetical protein